MSKNYDIASSTSQTEILNKLEDVAQEASLQSVSEKIGDFGGTEDTIKKTLSDLTAKVNELSTELSEIQSSVSDNKNEKYLIASLTEDGTNVFTYDNTSYPLSSSTDREFTLFSGISEYSGNVRISGSIYSGNLCTTYIYVYINGTKVFNVGSVAAKDTNSIDKIIAIPKQSVIEVKLHLLRTHETSTNTYTTTLKNFKLQYSISKDSPFSNSWICYT